MAVVRSRFEIDTYIYLWESFYRANSLLEFEKRYVQKRFLENRASSDYKLQFFDTLNIFLSKWGVSACVSFDGNELLIDKSIVEAKNNIYSVYFVKLLEQKIDEILDENENENIDKISISRLEDLQIECFGHLLEGSWAFEIYKDSIKKLLSLEERDAVFLLGKKLVIKYFKKQLDNPSERRFNGIDKEELDRLYKRFEKVDYEQIVKKVTFNIINRELNLKAVDNITFHRSYIKLIQSNLNKVFKKSIPNESLLVGFVNYMLRVNFHYAMEVITQALMTLVSQNNDNIKQFINFYDGRDIFIENKKHQKSEIIVDKQRMSFYPIYAIAVQYNSLLSKERTKIEDIESLNCELIKKSTQQEHIKKKIAESRRDLAEFEGKSTSSAMELRELRNEYQKLQIEQKKAISKSKKDELGDTIDTIKEKIRRWSSSDSDLLNHKNTVALELERYMIKSEDIKKDMIALEGNIDRESDKLNELEIEIEEISKRVNSIREAIKSAIMRFRI